MNAQSFKNHAREIWPEPRMSQNRARRELRREQGTGHGEQRDMAARTGSSAWAAARVHDEQARHRDPTTTARELRVGLAWKPHDGGEGVAASWSTAADDADKLHDI
jgi:hypothetical protein